MREPAACHLGTGRVNRAAAFFDVDDLAFLIDDESGAVGHSHAGQQHTVIRRIAAESAWSGFRLGAGSRLGWRGGLESLIVFVPHSHRSIPAPTGAAPSTVCAIPETSLAVFSRGPPFGELHWLGRCQLRLCSHVQPRYKENLQALSSPAGSSSASRRNCPSAGNSPGWHSFIPTQQTPYAEASG